MGSYSPQIDQFILKSQPFAQPILNHLRALIHAACPEVEEKLKWGMPFFDYRGEMMCHIAAFKQHCAFGFWKSALMKDPLLMAHAKEEKAMGHLGKIQSMQDLPSDSKIVKWVREAMKLNDQGIKLPPKSKAIKSEITVPDDLKSALKKNVAARKTFDQFTLACRREYLDWITEAKRPETRQRRIEQAIAWMAECKKRNWKFERK